MDTLAKYPLTLEVDKTLEVRTTMAQLMELVEGRQMEGSVKSISNHPRGSSPYIKKKNDRFTGSYDILRLTLTIAPALRSGVHLDIPLGFGTGCFD
jgi:hypothetical protein